MKRSMIPRALLMLAIGAGCSETTTSPGAAAARVPLPAVTGASLPPRAHFLPPLAPSSERTGVADPALSPVVEVCAWTGSWSEDACTTPVARLTMGGPNPERVRVEEGYYIANWNSGRTGTDYTAIHRIRVLVGGVVEGYVDVAFARADRDVGGFVRVSPGATIPIKFWIDLGVAEERITVGEGGGTFDLFEGAVQLSFPAGVLPAGTALSIRQLEGDDLPTDPAPTFPGTVFRFGPTGMVFTEPVQLTLTFDPALLPAEMSADDVTIYHVATPGSTPEALEAIARTSNSVTVEINGFSDYFPNLNAIPVPPSNVWLGGAAGNLRTWSTAANWSLGRVPNASDWVVIPATTHAPQLTAAAVTAGLTVESGATLDLQSHPLFAFASVVAMGPIIGSGFVAISATGANVKLRGTLPELRLVGGLVTLSGNTTIERNVLVSGPSGTPVTALQLAAFTMNVGGEFRTQGARGQLLMEHSNAALNITGNLELRANGASSLLSKGVLTLLGGFRQADFPEAVKGEPAHRLILANGTSSGHVTVMDHPGQSYLGEVVLASSGGLVMFGDLVVNGTFSYDDAAIGAPILGGSSTSTLSVRDIAFLRGPVTLAGLRIGGLLGHLPAYAYNVQTTTFTGASPLFTEQTLGDIRFKDVVIDGGNVKVGVPFAQVGGKLTITSGRLGFSTGSARALSVAGNLLVEGVNSHLSMTQATDRMVVYGNATFRGRTLTNGMSAGRLWLGGHVTQGNGAGALTGTGTHTTILFGSGQQDIQFAQGQNSNWFARLAVTNAGAGVRFVGSSTEVRRRFDVVGKVVLASGVGVATDTVIYRGTSHSSGTGGAVINCRTAYREATAIVLNVGDATGDCKTGASAIPAQGDYAVPSNVSVQITSPANGSVSTVFQTITFTGTATGANGAALTGSALSWQSSIDGTFGTGASIPTSSLSIGLHLIRLVATDTDGTSGIASILVEVKPLVQAANLSVSMTVQPDPVTVGSSLTHTVTVANAGPTSVTNVVVGTEVLTSILTSGTPPAGCQTLTNGTRYVFVCTIASLAAGASVNLVTTVVPSTAETLTSMAVIQSWTGPADPDLTNNSVTETTVVNAPGTALTGTLVFESDRGMSGRSLFTRNLATGAVDALGVGSSPDWSADGARIAFVRSGEIWIMNADGSNAGPLSSTAGKASHPSWSPDGTQIVFMDLRSVTSFDISIVTVATGAIRTLTVSASNDRYPQWSPDGARILFSRDHATIRSVRASDGGGEEIHHTGTTRHARYSPDGSKIAYSAAVSGGFALRILTLSSGAITTVVNNGDSNWNPAWSPDGVWIMHSRNAGVVSLSALWAIRADGTGAHLVESSGFGEFSSSWK